ncbi:uncharacterized protein [Physcomitrium patens]|uniref:Uncharacterized protein n=1 Tax=Physcomitrium patens TaxID=3218 RepID=A0A2K1J324_PHYPA|nr:hypothetical protein PHYPA_021777 [Physcomitrium patens]
MQMGIGAFERTLVSARRALLNSTTLISPVPPRHVRTNCTLMGVIVVLMVLAVAAIACCCYQWEKQMRLQTQVRNSAAQDEFTNGTKFSDPPEKNPAFTEKISAGNLDHSVV